MSCPCSQFLPIELDRESVRKRINKSRRLKRELELLAKDDSGEHKLFKCPKCGKFWQASRAWSWGNEEYLFETPSIDPAEWTALPFEQPDELIVFSAVMRDYYERNSFETTNTPCRQESCSNFAIRYSVLCEEHHIAKLQDGRGLVSRPVGRRLPFYK